MQIVSGDNLHKMSNPNFWEIQEKYFKMLSAGIFTRMLSIVSFDLSLIIEIVFLIGS